MPVSNAPLNGLSAFVGFGAETDCDGTSYYACGVWAQNEDHAWEVIRADFGSYTSEYVWEIVSGETASSRGIDVDKLMARTFDNGVWNEDANQWESVTVPFRYESTGNTWS